MKKKSSDLSPGGKAVAGVLIAVSLVVVGAAERDIHRRPPSEIRGSARLWRLACLNAIGALAYFRWGRQASGE